MRPPSPLLLTAFLLAACGPPPESNFAANNDPAPSSTVPERPRPRKGPPKSPFVESSNELGMSLWSVLRNQPGNLAIAPATIHTGLAMALYGARGETAEEMKRTLHLEGDPNEWQHSANEVVEGWNGDNGPIELRVANRLFGQTVGYVFEKPFIDFTERVFHAPLDFMNFIKDPEKSRRIINTWVARETKERIPEIIPARSIDEDTRLILVSTMYFQAKWAHPFDPDDTRRKPFFVTSTEKKNVPMMNQTDEFYCAEEGGVKVLEMPYRGEGMSMVFLLPNKVDGLAALEQKLTAAEFDSFIDALELNERLEVDLPKFEIDPPSPIALKETLQSLGIRIAFDKVKADFTGIANPKDSAERLYISKIFHKAFVHVDEEGTVASAATSSLLSARGAMPETFKADHPFLFFLRDKKTGMILFMGRVVDPSAR